MFSLDPAEEDSTVVPTLHVLFVRTHERSLLTREYPHSSHSIPSLREELIDWISEESLGGDRDAAEWILLSCIAKVQVF